MKLHFLYEMDIDEEILRKEFHTRNPEETAIVARSFMEGQLAEAIESNNADFAENINIEVTVRE